MRLSFDYYHNLEKVELYLCNPDGRELFPLVGRNRNLTLRFNDLSELTFDIDSKVTLSDGTSVEIEAYEYIQTKRLIYATEIGWFQITGVDEHDDGKVKYKSIQTESYQSVLKNKGFISEERVYCFYNPNDPHDDRYDSLDDGSIPSVMGQWYKQLGIKQALAQGTTEPATPYADWTVTYINPNLIYGGEGESVCRTFEENTTYGYDWIVNDVENAFEVVVVFDFMFKTIHVMRPYEVAQKVNVIYTFENFMKNIDISENSNDIVTVLNCNGNNCDITIVNPTGTNYICDFSYFMDTDKYRWMSASLIAKLNQWKSDCDDEKDNYTTLVTQLRELLKQQAECQTKLQEMSIVLTDLRSAQSKRSVLGGGTPGALCGIVGAETVKPNSKSIMAESEYYSSAFTGNTTVTAYQYVPTYDSENKVWDFSLSGKSKTGTANSIVAENLSDDNTSGESYWYFADSDGSTYCRLRSAASVNKDSVSASYHCDGFDRYIAYTYPVIDLATGVTTYTDTLQTWINLRESILNELNTEDAELSNNIESKRHSLSEITSRLNILRYFADTPALLRELNCYWIEGDYVNENIAVLDETTLAEEIDLSNELIEAGYIELSKVCQPRFSFALESLDASKKYEFRSQMRLLELGKIITIEKEEGLWYYPALLELTMNLDNTDEFTMVFANAMRLDDWGYTYADLITDASSTSRKVSANWQEILSYAKERDEISSLIKDPLDATLRASFANMINQEFKIDNNGILGRKKLSETSEDFEDEQIRIINNLIIFTDDNWETAKTALGKIYYTDDDGNLITSYGLIAETIIGSLIMGERLKIINTDSTIELGAEGITIKQSDGTIVFQAKPSGEIFVKGYATSETVEGEVTTLTNAIVTTETNCKSYADSAVAEYSKTVSATYATKDALSGEVQTLSKADVTTLESAKSYADSAVAEYSKTVSATYATQTALAGIEAKAEASGEKAIATLTLSTSASGKTASITLKSGDTNLSTGSIEMSGLVSFTDLSTSGSTTICGDNITTGTISAQRIDATNLKVSAANITSGTFGGFTFDGTGLSKTTTTLPDDNQQWYKNTFEVAPGYLLTDYCHYSSWVPAEVNKTEIRNGYITISVSNLVTGAFNIAQKFMTVNLNGTTYNLFIDPDTQTVKAIPQ